MLDFFLLLLFVFFVLFLFLFLSDLFFLLFPFCFTFGRVEDAVTMSYSEAADVGVPDIRQPQDGHGSPGGSDLQKRLSSMELTSNAESPNQVYMP